MKKLSIVLLTVIMCISMAGCKRENVSLSILSPSGTPLMAISNYLVDNDVEYTTSAGTDALMSGFVNSSYDVIVAPTNLGLKMYNNNGNYRYLATIVWGNLYICSDSEISSFEDLDGKSVVAFGENSTPGIVMKALISHYDINVNVTYYGDVGAVNPLFVSGQAHIILSAEPQVSVLKGKKTLYTYDIQQEYIDVFGKSVPQASIFVKSSIVSDNSKMERINRLLESVNTTNTNANTVRNIKAVESNFETLSDSVLASAISKSNIRTLTSIQDRESINHYIEVLESLNMMSAIGGAPSEECYIQ